MTSENVIPIQIVPRRAGNQFFERNLRNYTALGIPYTAYWQKANHDFIRFQLGGTSQGIDHCMDVENNLWKLLIDHLKVVPKEMLYVLSLTCALHDLGKTEKAGKESHADIGARIIHKKLVDLGYVIHQLTAEAIAFVASSHESGDFSSVPKEVKVGDVTLFLRCCAAIFRLADMMSTTEDRGARLHQLLDIPHETLNRFLNNVRLNIRSCDPSDDDRSSIIIRANLTDKDVRSDIEGYVKGLNQDLTAGQIKLLQNVKTQYLTKSRRLKVGGFTLPYKFDLETSPSYAELPRTVVESAKVISIKGQSVSHGYGRLIRCFFLNTDTDLDIYQKLYDCVSGKKTLDPKFLYWTLRSTQAYLSLSQNPYYRLNDIAYDFILKTFLPNLFPIIWDSQNQLVQIIDMGVGDGSESNILINAILSISTKDLYLHYTLFDCSYHMLRVAANSLERANHQNNFYRRNIELNAVYGDIRDIPLFRKVTGSVNGKRLFVLLGATLGNYYEREIIEPIQKELSNDDYLLLGLELIGKRTDDDLRTSYDSLFNRKFVFLPLQDLGYEFEESEFSITIQENISDVAASKTIISNVDLPDIGSVRLAISTKYNLDEFMTYVEETFRLQVITSLVNESNNYALLLLKK